MDDLMIAFFMIGLYAAALMIYKNMRATREQPARETPKTVLQERVNTQILEHMFEQTWNGTEQDREYAWFRVKASLMAYWPESAKRERLLLEADLNALYTADSTQTRSYHFVDSKGRMIQRTIKQSNRRVL